MNNDIEITESDIYDPVYFQIGYLNQYPHKKQIEVLRSKQKNKIIVCGRRSGKSQLIAGELIRGAVLGLYPKQILITPQYKQSIIIFDKIIELLTTSGNMGDVAKVVQSPYPKIVFLNGDFIDFASADNPNSLRGDAYDRVFKDESAFIKKGADNAIKPLTYDRGAPVWETTTPWGKGEVWEKWIRGMKGDEDYGCFHYCYKDNPYLSAEGKKEIEKDIIEYGEDSLFVQAEIYGNFIEDRDCFFTRELIMSCVEEYNMPIPNNRLYNYYMGVDFARMGEDVTVFIPLMEYGGGFKVNDVIEIKKKVLTEAIGQIVNLESQYNFIKILTDETGLGSGPTDILVEKFGYKVNGICFTVKSKQDMYSNLKKIMQQGKLKIPNHKKMIYELMDLRYETTTSGDLKLHHSDRGHDDYPDALALACWAAKDECGYRPTLA